MYMSIRGIALGGVVASGLLNQPVISDTGCNRVMGEEHGHLGLVSGHVDGEEGVRGEAYTDCSSTLPPMLPGR